MDVYGDYVFIGGGGGYEIANKILVYKMPADTRIPMPLLKDLVHEEPTQTQVANYMATARDVC